MNYKLITLSIASIIFIAMYYLFVYDYKESQRKKRNDLKPVIPRTTEEGYVIPSEDVIEDLDVARISVSVPLPPKGSTESYGNVGERCTNPFGGAGTVKVTTEGTKYCSVESPTA